MTNIVYENAQYWAEKTGANDWPLAVYAGESQHAKEYFKTESEAINWINKQLEEEKAEAIKETLKENISEYAKLLNNLNKLGKTIENLEPKAFKRIKNVLNFKIYDTIKLAYGKYSDLFSKDLLINLFDELNISDEFDGLAVYLDLLDSEE